MACSAYHEVRVLGNGQTALNNLLYRTVGNGCTGVICSGYRPDIFSARYYRIP
jgi:hypothetical protein